MIRSFNPFEWEGRMLSPEDIDDYWELEFSPDEAARIKPLSGIDAALCDCVNIAKTHDGLFFMFWDERHPEMPRFEEFYRWKEEGDEWEDLVKRLPFSHHVDGITRHEAFAIIALLWLPEEFHGDLALPDIF